MLGFGCVFNSNEKRQNVIFSKTIEIFEKTATELSITLLEIRMEERNGCEVNCDYFFHVNF